MKTSATRTLFAFSVLFVLACLGTSIWLWANTAPVKAQSEPSQLAGQEIAEPQGSFPIEQLAIKTTPSLSPDQAFTDLSVDDGFPEAALGVSGGGTITGVNRLTPPGYPSTLTHVALYFQSQMGLAPGAPITILVGTNPSGSANLSNISFTQINTVAETGGSYFFYTVSPVTINSGDFVVGWRATHAAGILPLPVDRTQPRNQRSYISTGGALSPLDTTAPAFAGNLLIRARVQGQPPGCPSVSGINPLGGVVGSQVTITGNNFTGVSAVRFTGGVNAQFTVNSNTQITTTVPQGATTGPLTISKPNCSDVQTSAFAINTSSATELAVDDGSFESGFGLSGGGTSWRVNRLTPLSYPATLSGISIFFRTSGNLTVGAPLTIVYGANSGGTPNINGIQLQTMESSIQALGQFNVYNVSPLTINSGDFVVGYKITHDASVFPYALDTTPPSQRRSYRSLDGVTYNILDDIPQTTAGNYGIRARLQGATQTCPTVSGINPASGAVGSQVTITGNNFTGVTAVRFTGGVNAQFTVNSNTQITATVPQGAATGPLTISKPSCSDVQTSAFSISTGPATELAIDDGSFEGAIGSSAGSLTMVNRLTPTSYPATLNGVSIFFRSSDGVQTGAPLTLLIGAYTGTDTGQLNGINFQSVPVTVQALGQFNVYTVPNLTINAGDFVIGFRMEHISGVRPFALDQSPPRRARSYLCAGDPPTCLNTENIGGVNVQGNLGIRARLALGAAPTTISTISAASFLGNEQASEAIVAGFGANLSNTTEVASSLPLPTTLAGLTLTVRDSANREQFAQFFFVSPGQINYLLPPNMTNGLANVTLMRGATVIATGTIQIALVAPGLFAANANGQGPAAAIVLRVRADGSQSFEPVIRFDQATNRFVTVPIDLGPETDRVFLLLFGTGFRQRSALSAVSALIGGTNAEVFFAGAQGDLAGLDQANVSLPRSLIGRGEVDVMLTVDAKTANTVRIAIR